MTSTLQPQLSPKALSQLPSYPWIGHALDYRLDPLGFYTRCAANGDLVRLHFGSHPVYFLNHPDLIKEVFVTKGSCFMARAEGRESRFFDPLFGNGLSVSEGSFWRRQRRMVQPLFQKQHLTDYGDMAIAATQNSVVYWQNGQIIETREAMLRLCREIVVAITFGQEGVANLALFEAVLNAALKEYSNREHNWLLYLLPEHFPTPDNRRYQQTAQQLDEWIYQTIQARRNQPDQDGSDMLSILLKARDESGQGMTDEEIRDELVNVIVGHDTVPDVFCWAWWLIAQHPEVESQLATEWKTVLDGRSPSFDDISRLPYTEAVVKETLRLFPLAWVTGRVATEDCELNGTLIHRGENVVMCQWVTHRDSRFFDQPNEFQPDRWLGDRAKNIPTYAYYPFGGGPRICVGRGLTMMETVLMLAEIGQRFQLILLPHQNITPHPGPSFSLHAKHGIKMRLSARS